MRQRGKADSPVSGGNARCRDVLPLDVKEHRQHFRSVWHAAGLVQVLPHDLAVTILPNRKHDIVKGLCLLSNEEQAKGILIHARALPYPEKSVVQQDNYTYVVHACT